MHTKTKTEPVHHRESFDKSRIPGDSAMFRGVIVMVLAVVSGCANDPMDVYNIERAPKRSWDASAKGSARSESEAVNRSVYRELDAKPSSSPMRAGMAFVGASLPGQPVNGK
jgi:hypothetical protein